MQENVVFNLTELLTDNSLAKYIQNYSEYHLLREIEHAAIL